MDMQLSKSFSLTEFTQSPTAQQHGIDNTPPQQAVNNLTCLCVNVLQPLRDWYGKPIRINSGYRCPALNLLTGGAATSHHCMGYAADISAGSPAENEKLFGFIRSHCSFTQLINEKAFTWVHVSYVEGNLKKQVLAIS